MNNQTGVGPKSGALEGDQARRTCNTDEVPSVGGSFGRITESTAFSQHPPPFTQGSISDTTAGLGSTITSGERRGGGQRVILDDTLPNTGDNTQVGGPALPFSAGREESLPIGAIGSAVTIDEGSKPVPFVPSAPRGGIR